MEQTSCHYTQAKNIVNYLRIIHRILAPGGVWINLGMESVPGMSRALVDSYSYAGPLLWHFEENTTNDPSIELDLEEVKTLAAHMGFEIKVSPSYPQLVSRDIAYAPHRMNARSIRPTSITKNQCLGIYTTPLSGLPQKSCNFSKAIPKRKVYRIDITDNPVLLFNMTWAGGGADVDMIRG